MPTNALRPSQINKYRAQWEFAHAHADVHTTPPWVQIARSNLCNFACVYCADHRAGNEVRHTKMEGEAWERLLTLIPRSEMMGFHGVSEFMIDPEFFDVVNRCAIARVVLTINTNGSVCTAKHRDVLALYPGRINLIFSIDAATPETYLHIRRWDFTRVIENVKSYVACLRPRPHPTFIVLSYVITKSNVHEMGPFVLLGKSLGVDYVRFSRLCEYPGLDWRVETTPGRYFDYREECVNHCVEAYNRNVDEARKAAEISGMAVELPPPIAARPVEKVPT